MRKLVTGLLCGLPLGVALAQENPYTYVKMSLTVPWTLYFVFLGAVLIPFFVMILIAWRRHSVNRPKRDAKR